MGSILILLWMVDLILAIIFSFKTGIDKSSLKNRDTNKSVYRKLVISYDNTKKYCKYSWIALIILTILILIFSFLLSMIRLGSPVFGSILVIWTILLIVAIILTAKQKSILTRNWLIITWAFIIISFIVILYIGTLPVTDIH